MKSKIRSLIFLVPIGRIALKLRIAWRYLGNPITNSLRWAVSRREENNFYYQVTDLNRDQIIHACGNLLKESYEKIENYIKELENDQDIRHHIASHFLEDKKTKGVEVDFGRRIAWYAIARAMKPKVVVETGVAHGVGACVIAKALEENGNEGFPGKYIGTDIDVNAGLVFSGRYSKQGKILFGDSIVSLRSLDCTIDLFINDSDHDPDYEYREYWEVHEKLSQGALIIGDNAHATISLSRFSRETNREFSFIAEFPKDHWYPGAGIGISAPR